MSQGQLLAATIATVLDGWVAEGVVPPPHTAVERPAGVFCAATHPLDDAALCGRLAGHYGDHTAATLDPWTDHREESMETPMPASECER